jgi:peroxiredoxin
MVLVEKHGSDPYPIGEPIPHFEALLGTDGQTYCSSDFEQAVQVIVFTCNHCPYAVAYEDRLIQLAHDFQPRGVAFIAISSNDADNYPKDSYTAMQQRAKDKSFPFPYLYDESQAVAKAFRAVCTPHIFVAQHGILKYRGRIDNHWRDPAAATEHDLRDCLNALLNDQPVPRESTDPMGCSIKWKWD